MFRLFPAACGFTSYSWINNICLHPPVWDGPTSLCKKYYICLWTLNLWPSYTWSADPRRKWAPSWRPGAVVTRVLIPKSPTYLSPVVSFRVFCWLHWLSDFTGLLDKCSFGSGGRAHCPLIVVSAVFGPLFLDLLRHIQWTGNLASQQGGFYLPLMNVDPHLHCPLALLSVAESHSFQEVFLNTPLFLHILREPDFGPAETYDLQPRSLSGPTEWD